MKSLISLLAILAQEPECIAKTVYYESKNQPIEGQLAVAKVVLNRTESEQWPDTACAVVNQKHQFSWTNEKLPEPQGDAWQVAKIIAITVYILPDPTNGATHFHANYVKPSWASRKKKVVQIGDHIFYA